MTTPPPSRLVASHGARRWRSDVGRASGAERVVPEELPIGLAYDSRAYVVLMGSPGDVEDLALGFTISERIAAAAEVRRITVEVTEFGVHADVLLSPEAGARLATARRRTLEARSSCGLCGVEALADAVRAPLEVGAGPRIAPARVQRALDELRAGQSLGLLTRATHAAAWIDLDLDAQLVREDVGRHNALDKAIGAAARLGRDPARAMIAITSRCSYEMVDKTAAAGVAVLVAISAPTALAIRQAEAAGLTLIALARADGHMVFTRPDRLEGA